jgi:hypothetical protein
VVCLILKALHADHVPAPTSLFFRDTSTMRASSGTLPALFSLSLPVTEISRVFAGATLLGRKYADACMNGSDRLTSALVLESL